MLSKDTILGAPIERVVAVLTPFFAAAAGWLSSLIAKAVPGLNIPASDYTAIFIAGATIAGGAALHWLSGRQKFVAITDQSREELQHAVSTIRADLAANAPAQAAVDDIRLELDSHKQDILTAIDKQVPSVVGQSIAALFSNLTRPSVTPTPAPGASTPTQVSTQPAQSTSTETALHAVPQPSNPEGAA